MATIASYVQPVELYRYRSLKKIDRELDAIERKSLYCAAFDNLNDPMEGLFRSTARFRMNEDYKTIIESIRENKANTGICSFSEVNNHGPMWAHYADEFRGICIAYSLSKLLLALPPEVTFVRMFYNEDVPAVSRSESEPAKKILSYKNYRWLYEREWRMFGTRGLASYGNSECISRVYLGSRMSDAHSRKVNAKLGQVGIPSHDMIIDKYSIGFESTS